MPADELPGIESSTVPGHDGLVSGIELPTGDYALSLPRKHLYEGKGVESVSFPIHLAAACGCEVVILTNGAGATTEEWHPGEVGIISDHINLTGVSPLEGPNFADLTDLYSRRIRELVRSVDPAIKEGVYAQFRGPNYETAAEIKMAHLIGADLVGMSTALEAIVARALGLEVLGLSLVTNLAAGISSFPLSHGEVVDVGNESAPRLQELLQNVTRSLLNQW